MHIVQYTFNYWRSKPNWKWLKTKRSAQGRERGGREEGRDGRMKREVGGERDDPKVKWCINGFLFLVPFPHLQAHASLFLLICWPHSLLLQTGFPCEPRNMALEALGLYSWRTQSNLKRNPPFFMIPMSDLKGASSWTLSYMLTICPVTRLKHMGCLLWLSLKKENKLSPKLE